MKHYDYATFSSAKLDDKAKSRIEERRMPWPRKDMALMEIDRMPASDARHTLLKWVDEHTEGEFYLGGRHISFVEERDAIMFKLGFKVDD